MAKTDFSKVIERSKKIRESYHQLERQHRGSEWTVEEDALAFLTDAGLVGRHTMSQQKRWLANNTDTELEHKLGELLIKFIKRIFFTIKTRPTFMRMLLQKGSKKLSMNWDTA